MSRFPVICLFVITWLAVFGQTQFTPARDWLGVPVGFVPAIVVYAALRHSLGLVTILSVVGALWMDSLSAHRLGVTVLPLFLLGYITHQRQHVILRDQRYAQFWMGVAGGIFVPLAVLVVLHLGQREPIASPATVIQLIVMGLLNGVMCPACFTFFDWIRHTFDYRPVVQSSFRPDREIKRGKT